MALLDQRVSLPQIPRSSALPTAHRRSAAAGWCWRRACDRIDPRPRVKMGRKNHHGCDGNPIWSHKYPHGNQGGCTKSCENTITKSINRPGLRWCRALDGLWGPGLQRCLWEPWRRGVEGMRGNCNPDMKNMRKMEETVPFSWLFVPSYKYKYKISIQPCSNGFEAIVQNIWGKWFYILFWLGVLVDCRMLLLEG